MRIFSNSKSNRTTRAALAIAVACSLALPMIATTTTPAQAQTHVRFSIGFNYFSDRLAGYGRWVDHPRWGEVWLPRAADFRPYYSGRWEYTMDYGWFWVGYEPWADVVYHYGRWAFDPYYGWMWVPGYVWGPSWVIWREVDGYLGWFPMPPDYYEVYAGYGPRFISNFSSNDWYGYRNWYGASFSQSFFNLWVFVDSRDFGRPGPYRYVHDKTRVRDFYTRGQDRTRYEVRNDRIVNTSIAVERVQRSTENRFRPREAGELIRNRAPITTVSEGSTIARRDREERVKERASRQIERREIERDVVRTPAPRTETVTVRERAEREVRVPRTADRSQTIERERQVPERVREVTRPNAERATRQIEQRDAERAPRNLESTSRMIERSSPARTSASVPQREARDRERADRTRIERSARPERADASEERSRETHGNAARERRAEVRKDR